MIDKAGLIHRRAHFHCGWAILVPPTLSREYVNDGETLRLYDDDREVSVSSMLVKSPDSSPWIVEKFLSRWPPEFLQGISVSHFGNNVHGRAIVIHKLGDDGSAHWVLMGLQAALEVPQLLRVTIAVNRAEQQQWAIDIWRSVVNVGDDHTRLAALMEDPPALIENKPSHNFS